MEWVSYSTSFTNYCKYIYTQRFKDGHTAVPVSQHITNLLVRSSEVVLLSPPPIIQDYHPACKTGPSTWTCSPRTVSYDHDICQTMKIRQNRREKLQREQRLAIELNYLFFPLKHNSVKLIYEHRSSLCLLHIKCHPGSEQERRLRRIWSQRLLGTHGIESMKGEKVPVLSSWSLSGPSWPSQYEYQGPGTGLPHCVAIQVPLGTFSWPEWPASQPAFSMSCPGLAYANTEAVPDHIL